MSAVSAWPSYDVFINFRDGDTRRNVASHLHAELCRRKIPTYIDDRVLHKGYEMGASLMEAIEKSRVDVFVYPENYAYPKWWCLDELMESKKEEQAIYRDFKASNILLDRNYNLKISDFGFARLDFYEDTKSMALGGLASTNKDEVTSKIMNNANKETSQKSEDPEMGFKMNASIFQSQPPTKGNNHDEDSNPFGLSGSILRSPKKRKENMGKFCSSLATFSFPLFMFSTILGHPLKETQGSLVSILVSSLAMLDLIAFIFAVSVMILVRWRFTWVQIATMLISAMAIRVAHSNLVISVLLMLMEAPTLAIVLEAIQLPGQNSQLVPH